MIEHNSKDDFSLIYSLVRCFAKSGSVQLFGGRSRASESRAPPHAGHNARYVFFLLVLDSRWRGCNHQKVTLSHFSRNSELAKIYICCPNFDCGSSTVINGKLYVFYVYGSCAPEYLPFFKNSTPRRPRELQHQARFIRPLAVADTNLSSRFYS